MIDTIAKLFYIFIPIILGLRVWYFFNKDINYRPPTTNEVIFSISIKYLFFHYTIWAVGYIFEIGYYSWVGWFAWGVINSQLIITVWFALKVDTLTERIQNITIKEFLLPKKLLKLKWKKFTLFGRK